MSSSSLRAERDAADAKLARQSPLPASAVPGSSQRLQPSSHVHDSAIARSILSNTLSVDNTPIRESVASSKSTSLLNLGRSSSSLSSASRISFAAVELDRPKLVDTLQSPLQAGRRHSLSRHDSSASIQTELSVQPTSTLSLVQQESVIIEDLLYMLMGTEGNYISYRDGPFPLQELTLDATRQINITDVAQGLVFRIDSSLDHSLIDLITRILPVAAYRSIVEAFCTSYSRFEPGLVAHALCGALRTLLKEYMVLIAQLEHQFRSNPSFSLQKFWFYIHPSLESMRHCAELTLAVCELSRPPKSMSMASLQSSSRFASMADVNSRPSKPAHDGTLTSINNKDKATWYPKGGGLLGLLTDRMIAMSGDIATRNLYTYLLEAATRPYLELVRKWINHGQILDQYEEFMVQEHQNIRKEDLKSDFSDAYWEQRYTIRQGAVPQFLEPLKNVILTAGKYLNAIAECGVKIATFSEICATDNSSSNTPSKINSIPYDVTRPELAKAIDGSGKYIADIERAYRFANKSLLELLVNEKNLLARLRSIKRYFFLDQSDFFTHFLDQASDELRKPVKQISLTKLQSILELSLRNPASVTASDPYKDDLKIVLSSMRLKDHLSRILGVVGMNVDGSLSASVVELAGLKETSKNEIMTGFDALVFHCDVPFPLSLVITTRTLTKYQLLFRNVFSIRQLERSLSQVWQESTRVDLWRRLRRRNDRSNPQLMRLEWRLQQLRIRMITFVQQLSYYITGDVLEPNWHSVEAKITQATTVDEVLQIHGDFLDTCLIDCMLTTDKLLSCLNQLMYLCTRFRRFSDECLLLIGAELNDIRYGDPTLNLTATPTTVRHTAFITASPAPGPGGEQTQADRLMRADRSIQKFHESWAAYMRNFIDMLTLCSSNVSSQLLYLIVRLDYNGFYAGNSGISTDHMTAGL